jgi:hypothetical protein
MKTTLKKEPTQKETLSLIWSKLSKQEKQRVSDYSKVDASRISGFFSDYNDLTYRKVVLIADLMNIELTAKTK